MFQVYCRSWGSDGIMERTWSKSGWSGSIKSYLLLFLFPNEKIIEVFCRIKWRTISSYFICILGRQVTLPHFQETEQYLDKGACIILTNPVNHMRKVFCLFTSWVLMNHLLTMEISTTAKLLSYSTGQCLQLYCIN